MTLNEVLCNFQALLSRSRDLEYRLVNRIDDCMLDAFLNEGPHWMIYSSSISAINEFVEIADMLIVVSAAKNQGEQHAPDTL